MMTMHWFPGLVLALALGCTARGSGGGGGGGADAGGGGGGTDSGATATGCAAICGRLAGAAGCTSQHIDACVMGCEGLRAGPSRCQSAVGALLSCASSATPSCMVMGFPFVGCDAHFNAYSACVVGGATDAGITPPRDVNTGDPCATAQSCGECTGRSSCGWCAGRCWTGQSGGPVGGSCGGDRWAWTTNMCSAPPVQDSGINNPFIGPDCQSCAFELCVDEVQACLGDSGCVQCLMGALTPACSTRPTVAALVRCACGGCGSACAIACGSR